jgi:LysR family hydrogen peroxide-inducible transcriptional activator
VDFRSIGNYHIEWLTAFVAVAQYGGFSAAAKALYRSQPRVSNHVAALEQELGTRLFDRSTHPAALTPEGRALLPHAQHILQRLAVLSELGSGRGAVHGEVRIGAYPSAAAYLFPLAVSRLRRTHPEISLVLREGPSVALGSALLAADVDVAVRPVMPLLSDSRLASRVLWREPLVAVVAAGHQLAGAPYLRLAQVARFPLVTIGEIADGVGRQFEANLAFAQAGLTPAIAFQTNQPQTLVSMVRHGLGVGVTNGLAMTTANTEGTVLIPLADALCERQVALWWRTEQNGSPAVDATRKAIAAIPVPRWPWGSSGSPRRPEDQASGVA